MARREDRSADDPPRPAPRDGLKPAPRATPREPAAGPRKKPTADIRIPVEPESGPESASMLDELGLREFFLGMRRYFATGAPGLMVSLAAHMLVLTLLGMIVYESAKKSEGMEGIEGAFVSGDEAALYEQNLAKSIQAVQIEAVPADGGEGGKPKADQPEADKPAAQPGQGDIPVSNAPGVGDGLSGRSGQKRSGLLKRFGGTKGSEDAVGKGLSWLTRQQQSDGHWELHKGYDDPGRASLKTDTGATALALLCYLGAGFTHQEGKHQEVVRKGLSWLRKVQKPNGNLHDWEEQGRQTAFYAHGQGTMALCEAYALTHDRALREPARKALQYIYDSQNEHGGWQYQPGAVGDLSVTGWQMMAMQSARMAGMDVPEEVLVRTSQFLNSVASQGGSRYRYKASDSESSSSAAMTAEGLLCRQYLGWPKDHPPLTAGVAWLLEDQNLPQWKAGRRNVYFWYYATQVMHHMEGEEWERWNGSLRDQIVSNQVKAGRMAGSWHPSLPAGDDHEYGESGGRLYVTCLSILTLEVYYRHLPLYRDKALPE